DGDTMTHAAYDALGGVTGVMATRGEAVLDELGAEAEDAFRNLVRGLVKVDAGDLPATGRTIEAGLYAAESPEGRLIAALRDAHLLVSDRERLRLAHESLISGWARLNAVISDEQQRFSTRERLVSLCRHWLDVPEGQRRERRRRLLRGLSLEEGRDLLEHWGPTLLSVPLAELPAFIRQSQRAARVRRLTGLALASSVSVAIMAGLLLALWLDAERARSERLATVRLEIARAEAALRSSDWQRALDAARAALALEDSFATRTMALAALTEHSSSRLLDRLPRPVQSARFAADGDLWTLTDRGTFTRYTSVGAVTRRVQTPSPDFVRYVDFQPLPDGELIVVLSDGRVGHVASVTIEEQDGTHAPDWLAPKADYFLSNANQIAFHMARDRFLVAVGDLGTTPGLLLSCTLGPDIACAQHALPSGIRAVAFSTDARWLAVAGDSRLSLVDPSAPDTTPISRTLGPESAGTLLSLAWSANGATLLAGTSEGRIVSLDTTAPVLAEAARHALSDVPVQQLSGAPSGARIAATCGDAFLCLLTVDDRHQIANDTRLYRLPAATIQLAWSSEGQRLASVHVGQDGGTLVWTMTPDNPVLEVLHALPAPLTALAVDHRHGRVAVGDGDGQVWIATLDDRQGLPRRLALAAGEIVHLAFSADGTLGVATRDGELARVPMEPDASIVRASIGESPQRVAWSGDGKKLFGTTANAVLRLDPEGRLQALDGLGLAPGQSVGGLTGMTPDDALIYSLSDGSLMRWAAGTAAPLLPAASSADRLSALSLSLHPNGRWLTATRADDELRVYDLTAQVAPLRLPLPSKDTKTVAFSPSGDLLAALGSDDGLHLWRFDPENGHAEPIASVPAVPSLLQTSADGLRARQASWIAWIDDTHLGIATRGGRILSLLIDPERWRTRIEALRSNRP
ncbi:MAG: WD40 repeat domain-containing protein, partial [Gammaproteobacteria bacterium]|nr:WD40 repeat domain-containing protein [Gammaproteobacteria bacterium]